MAHQLSFAAAHNYDTRQLGINVPVTLRSGAQAVRIDAAIDTGASYCIFERVIGEKLGFDVERGAPQWVGSVRGSFLTFGHEVSLAVLGIEVVATALFAAEESFTRNVLGRAGWLDRVRLGLVDYDGRLYLSHYEDMA
jgi:hypothetical protein